jgi:hypothetical protein
MIVYIVTHGSYSDYGLEGVFSSREKAQEYIDHETKDNEYSEFNDILEVEVDNVYNLKVRDNYKHYTINIDIDGNIWTDIGGYSWFDLTNKRLYNHFYTIYRDNSIFFNIVTKDKEHAIKIANDKRAELIALNQWNICEKVYF